MNDIVFKSNSNIGDISAEQDKEFLDKCFIKTNDYEDIINFNNKKMIILGRTGVGKTAILQELKKTTDIYISINPEEFSLEYINSIDFILRLKSLGVNLDIFYKFMWLHVIVSNIIKEYCKFFDESSFISQLEKIGERRKIKDLKKYIEDNRSCLFESEIPYGPIEKELTKNLSASLGNNILKTEGALQEKEVKKVQTLTNEYINRNQIKQLHGVVDALSEEFNSNKQKKIAVVIDNLDTNWAGDDLAVKYKLINALLTVVREFDKFETLKVCIGVRADIWKQTCETQNRQNEKDKSFLVNLSWTRGNLIDLVSSRIKFLFEHKYQSKKDVTFYDIFPKKVDGFDGIDYIINRTMMRPRDAISFVNRCISQAEGTSKVSELNVKNAEDLFLQDRYDALEHEWSEIYPSVKKYIVAIRKLSKKFTYKEIIKNFKDIESVILNTNNFKDKILKVFLDSKDKEEKVQTFLKALYVMGVVATVSKNGNLVFSNIDKIELSELDFEDDAVFEIHPLFSKNNN